MNQDNIISNFFKLYFSVAAKYPKELDEALTDAISLQINTTSAEAGILVYHCYIKGYLEEQNKDKEIVRSRPKIGDSNIVGRDIDRFIVGVEENKKSDNTTKHINVMHKIFA